MVVGGGTDASLTIIAGGGDGAVIEPESASDVEEAGGDGAKDDPDPLELHPGVDGGESSPQVKKGLGLDRMGCRYVCASPATSVGWNEERD